MSPDLRAHYLAIAEALPAGTAVPVPVELLVELLAGGGDPGAISDAPPPDFTVPQVAARFGRKPSTVRGWIAGGQLPGAYHFRGRELRIPAAAVMAFEAGQRGHDAIPAAAGVRRRARQAPDLGGWRKVAP